jgi:glutamate dehydrogenase
MSQVWDEVAALDNLVPSEVQTEILLRGRRLVERSTRWLLRKRRQPIDVAGVVTDYGGHLEAARELIDVEVSELQRNDIANAENDLQRAGVPAELAQRSVGHDRMALALDIIETSRVMACALSDAAVLWFRLEARLGLHWLSKSIAELPRTHRWESLARSALRDELSQTHAELTATVLRAVTGRGGTPNGRAVDHWLETNGYAVRRLDTLRAAVIAERAPGLEPLTVILRELRSLADG